MHTAFELVRQCRIDHAVTFEPALPPEGFGYNIEAEVALAPRAVSGVAFVQMGFILDMQTFRRERRDELCRDDILHSHSLNLSDSIVLRSISAPLGFDSVKS